MYDIVDMGDDLSSFPKSKAGSTSRPSLRKEHSTMWSTLFWSGCRGCTFGPPSLHELLAPCLTTAIFAILYSKFLVNNNI